MHALIIDDDPNSLKILGQILKLEGAEMTQVSNPLEVQLILEFLPKIDIIFLDLEMPVLDGYQMFAQLKNNPLTQNVPIVACTSHLDEMNSVRKLGFDGFLGKPITLETFSENLKHMLDGKGVWRR